jgi:hypothetical protein
MLRSVLTSCTKTYDTQDISSSFAQSLVIQTLDSVPKLTTFCLDTETKIDHSALLASMIRHLPNSKKFQYEYHYTDELIEQLRLHCRYLRKVSFKKSTRVTDASAQHLMQLRELVFVHLDLTRFTFQSYGLLLSELPKISNIVFWQPYSNFLDYIAIESLNTILYVSGYVRDFNILTQKCPNITHLNMYWCIADLTSLTDLTSLRSLRIARGSYISANLKAALQGIGHRLTELSLNQVRKVNLVDIVTLCSCLEYLVLERCKFIQFHSNIPLDPELPHFKSLIF